MQTVQHSNVFVVLNFTPEEEKLRGNDNSSSQSAQTAVHAEVWILERSVVDASS